MTRDRSPEAIRLATAARGGLCDKTGRVPGERLERRTGRPLELIESQGSLENRELLLAARADLPIVTTGFLNPDLTRLLGSGEFEPVPS